MPCVPYGGTNDQGFFFIPEVDSGVWIEFEEGNLEYPIWVGTFWSKPGDATEVPEPTDSQSSPSCKVIKTAQGHTIELVDEDGAECIRIYEKVDRNRVTIDKFGIRIEDNNGNEIIMDGLSGFPSGKNIKLNGNSRICIAGLIDWLMSHKHIGNLGGPCPLSPDDLTKLTLSKTTPKSGMLSDNVTVE
jgi:hypothetical protein